MSLRVALILDGQASGARAAVQATSADLDRLTAATRQQSAAAEAAISVNQRAASSSANVANIAAQFQDIGVTAAMGMSPLQIALQQGTQLSAVLGTQGAAGAARLLASSLMAIVSPASLITIAVVGLGAAALQAFGGMMTAAEDASSSLEKHEDWLKEILTGYDAAGKAAEAAAERARKLPQGVVVSDLKASLKEQEAAIESLQKKVDAYRESLTAQLAEAAGPAGPQMFGLNREDLAGFEQQIVLLRDLRISAASSREELEAAQVAAHELSNTAEDPAIRDMAAAVDELARELAMAKGEAHMTAGSLAEVTAEAIRFQTVQLDGAFEGLSKILPDNLDQFARMRAENEALAQSASAHATSYSAVVAVSARYQANLAAINELEAEAAAKEAARAARQVSAYDTAMQSLRERTAAQRLETDTIGAGTFAIERARIALELENAARKDAIGLTPARIAQIQAEATAYASAAAAQEAALELQKQQREETDFYRSTFSSFAVDAVSGLRTVDNAWEAVGNAAVSALDRISQRLVGMAADGLFDLLVSSIFGGGPSFSLGSGSAASIGAGIIGRNAQGTNNWRGGLTWVGEKGPEIVDLPAGSKVYSADESRAMAGGGVTFAPVSNFSVIGGKADIGAYQQLLDERDRALLGQFQQLVAGYLANPLRSAA